MCFNSNIYSKAHKAATAGHTINRRKNEPNQNATGRLSHYEHKEKGEKNEKYREIKRKK